MANGLNQLTSIGGSATAHDARGNLATDPTTGKTYGYSSENLLTSATGGITLAYDPQMRLYQVAGAATTRFAHDELDAIAEYDASNALQRRFVHGPGIDEPLVQYEGSGTTDRRFMSADERGSIISISDSSGNMLTINRYDEFGKPQSTNAGRFQYTGQMWLPEIGLYHYKARMYAPHLGRFLQTDPAGGANLYAYVLNNPVNLTDPLGLVVCIGSRINTDSCGNSPNPISCSGDCGALGGSLLTINEQRKADEAFNAGCPNVLTCNLLQPAVLPLLTLPGWHHYTPDPNVICAAAFNCSSAQVAAVYSLASNQIPGGPNQPIISGSTYTVYIAGVPIGLVTSTVTDDGLSILNKAQPLHLFSGPFGGWVGREAQPLITVNYGDSALNRNYGDSALNAPIPDAPEIPLSYR